MIQSAYNAAPPVGKIGTRVNMEEWNGFTCIAEDNSIAPGFPVADGTTGEQAKLFVSGGNFRGIAEADDRLLDTNGKYPKGANVPVDEAAVIWVKAAGTCTKRTAVYWDAANAGYTSTSTSMLAIPGAKFDTTAASGQLVAVRLRP